MRTRARIIIAPLPRSVFAHRVDCRITCVYFCSYPHTRPMCCIETVLCAKSPRPLHDPLTPKERRQKRELPSAQDAGARAGSSGPAVHAVQRAASRAFLPRVSLDISSALHYAHASGVCAYKSRALPCSPVCAPHSPTARSCGLRASAMRLGPGRRGRVIGARGLP